MYSYICALPDSYVTINCELFNSVDLNVFT